MIRLIFLWSGGFLVDPRESFYKCPLSTEYQAAPSSSLSICALMKLSLNFVYSSSLELMKPTVSYLFQVAQKGNRRVFAKESHFISRNCTRCFIVHQQHQHHINSSTFTDRLERNLMTNKAFSYSSDQQPAYSVAHERIFSPLSPFFGRVNKAKVTKNPVQSWLVSIFRTAINAFNPLHPVTVQTLTSLGHPTFSFLFFVYVCPPPVYQGRLKLHRLLAP